MDGFWVRGNDQNAPKNQIILESVLWWTVLIGWSRSTITFCSDRQIGWNQFHWKEDSQSFPLIYSRSPRSLCTRSYDCLNLEQKYARPQYFFLHVLLFTTIHDSIGMFITRRSDPFWMIHISLERLFDTLRNGGS